MTDIGVIAQRINSQGFKVYLDLTTDVLYNYLQNASLNISHSEVREPTTSGLVYYSGLPDNTLSGTLLLTTDLITGAADTGGLKGWLTRGSDGEYPTKALVLKLTDASATTSSYTFPSAKLASAVIYKGQEGGTKVDVTFVLLSNPTEYP